MTLHPWWQAFGPESPDESAFQSELAKDFAAMIGQGMPGVRLIALKPANELLHDAVHVEVDVERPQDLAHPIRAVEDIAVLFPHSGGMPRVFALRPDFPDTQHQNDCPAGFPRSLCIDDRPWSEAKLTTTPNEIARRIQLWLSKAAKGELHDSGQPPEPLFFPSTLVVVIPRSALADSSGTQELVGFLRTDNSNIIITQPATQADQGGNFVVLTFLAPSKQEGRMRQAPRTLGDLATELAPSVELLTELSTRLKGWAGTQQENVRRLSSRLIVIVGFPIGDGSSSTVDLRGFITHDSAGEVGEALGALARLGANQAFVPTIGQGEHDMLRPLQIEPVQVHLAFDRQLAAQVAGNPAGELRRVVQIGAGAIGSQMAVALTREGRFLITPVDGDFILPHNLARHALFIEDLGALKSFALARRLGGLLGETVSGIVADALEEPTPEALTRAYAEADVILDASASVAVARRLADLTDIKARRVSVFFNPTGTAVVVMAEDANREVNLRDLESQYHRMVLDEPSLANHLAATAGGIRYSGACRALTNKIPASRAAILSAIAASGFSEALSSEGATITVWTINNDGSVDRVSREGAKMLEVHTGPWTVRYDEGLLHQLASLRELKLPNETGGVLLGIADFSRKSIHLSHAMPPPKDSLGTPTEFERGVVGLVDEMNRVVESTMYQLRYIGEWHSHPPSASAWPSAKDLTQLAWLKSELSAEGLPGLMAIAADDGSYSILFGRDGETRDE
jgi:hypothetical protein